MSIQGRELKKKIFDGAFSALEGRGLVIFATYEGFDTVDANISTSDARVIRIPNVRIISRISSRDATADLRHNVLNSVLMHADELSVKALAASDEDVLPTTKDRIRNDDYRVRPVIGDCFALRYDDYKVGATDTPNPPRRAYTIQSVQVFPQLWGDTPIVYEMRLVAP